MVSLLGLGVRLVAWIALTTGVCGDGVTGQAAPRRSAVPMMLT